MPGSDGYGDTESVGDLTSAVYVITVDVAVPVPVGQPGLEVGERSLFLDSPGTDPSEHPGARAGASPGADGRIRDGSALQAVLAGVEPQHLLVVEPAAVEGAQPEDHLHEHEHR